MIGALAARRAARPPERRVGAAVSGAAGPLVVAVAYLLAAPRLAGIAAEQVSAHLLAPYAVIAGLAGSVLVTALAQRAERRGRRAGRVACPGSARARTTPTEYPAVRATCRPPTRRPPTAGAAEPTRTEPTTSPLRTVAGPAAGTATRTRSGDPARPPEPGRPEPARRSDGVRVDALDG